MMPAEPLCVIRDEPGLHRGRPGWTGENRGSTGKVLNCLIPPGRTGNDRRGTGNNRDGTVAPTGPIQTPAELRQRPGECRYSPGIATVYKKTGALPERHRRSPGLRRDITGDDRGKTGALP
ncbi:hypothetical protein DPMN_016947 [Dreissena polymorpha]|uniref:Uncharacterized protein n=1 Tax=Dreissena polymorpha TaxID=45954 RepID=A0A9D4S7N1_DREPO|nr:hypothetical protein DPMN_016947 [Dreissena polymorpha]